MSEAAQIWLHGRPIGNLTPTRNGATFQFEQHIASDNLGVPLLSASLPVQYQAFDADRTRAWFAGLLPEGRQLDEVRRRFDMPSGSFLEVLIEIGWECAGAVVVTRQGAEPPSGSYRQLTSDELALRLGALPRYPFDGIEALRISLGGFQAKMLATRIGDGWAMPVGGAISTHILKPQSPTTFPGLVEAEAWAMAVAAEVTETAATELLHIDTAPATLVVARFDRELVDGQLLRIHQEDGGQAMGVPPERKYASTHSGSKSDPTLLALAGILEKYAATPRTELRRLAEQMTVNVALGNTDAHAKNYGVLHPDARTIRLSPMYDVVPALRINPGMLDLGLRVASTLRIDRVSGAKLVAEATSWGLGTEPARRYVEECLTNLRSAVPVAQEKYPTADPELARTTLERTERLLLSL